MHQVTQPAILYFGTPVVLISTVNEDGCFNLAPISSAWWLGQRCVLGLAAVSKTTQNLIRTGQCVLNLPSDAMAEQVDRIARTTGSDPVPQGKARRGYRFVAQKFATAGLTPIPSLTVKAPRAMECPVQMEANWKTFTPSPTRTPPGAAAASPCTSKSEKSTPHPTSWPTANPTASTPINGAR
jgi:flavin reductase (DIM6/NTAB) family NADH-FMN oxidoreductase RutF